VPGITTLEGLAADVLAGAASSAGVLADWLEDAGDPRAAAARAAWASWLEARRRWYATRLDVPGWEYGVWMTTTDMNAALLALRDLARGILDSGPKAAG
jgi:hypothetical protein